MRLRRASPPADQAPQERLGDDAPAYDLEDLFAGQQQSGDRVTSPEHDTSRVRDRRRWPLVLGAVVLGAGASVSAVLGAASIESAPTPTVDPSSRGRLTAAPPPELPRVGSAVRTRLAPDGRVEVTHWIRSRFYLTGIDLPRSGDASVGSGVARVGDVSVAGEGGRAAATGEPTDRVRRFRFGVPAKLVRVRYTLSGALERSGGDGSRALIRTTALPVTGYAPKEGPVVVTVSAPEVLSLTCNQPDQVVPIPRPCGAPVAGGWRVTLRGGERQDQVRAQVDLAR